MELQIVLESDECNSCDLLLTDTTPLTNFGYLNEEYIGTIPGRFKYSETIGIGVLKQNVIDVKPESTVTGVNYHELSDERTITMKSPADAWYTIYYLVLPSINWFEEQLKILIGESSGILQLNNYSIIYYTDGINHYKAVRIPNTNNFTVTVVTIEYLSSCELSETTLSRTSIDYVSICFLNQCYLDISKLLLESKNFEKCFNKSIDETSNLYTRDLLWMSINTIRFSTEFNQLTEAQRIIEQIGGCNGICKPSRTAVGTKDCGCS